MKNKVAYYRNKQNLSQEKLALKSGITRPYLSDIERGTKNPSCQVALNISEALNLPVEEIFFANNVHYDLQNTC